MNKIFLLLVIFFSNMAYASACQSNRASANIFSLDYPEDRLLLIKQIPNSINRVLYLLDSDCKEIILGEFDDSPISIFYFSDTRKIFGTLWSSGTALVFRVFSVKTNEMILEAYSKSPPRIFWLTSQQNPIFYINNCNTCSNFGFYITGKNGIYHKATEKETNKIKKEIINDVINLK